MRLFLDANVLFTAAHNCGATHLLTGDLKHFGPYIDRPEDTLAVRTQTVSGFLSS